MTELSIRINLNGLPSKLQTQSIRKFYDKDNSGFIESRNKDGINEYKLFEPYAKSLGIDLSKYNITNEFTGGFVDGKGEQRIVKKGPYGYATQTWSSPYEVKDTIFDKQGRPIEIGYKKFDRKGWAKKSDCQQFRYTELTSGRYNLTKKETYIDCRSFSLGTNDVRPVSEPMEISLRKGEKQPRKATVDYTLNGKQVQAKPIGKGRYEVTDAKGNVSYISHDGVNLKPEYVRNNP